MLAVQYIGQEKTIVFIICLWTLFCHYELKNQTELKELIYLEKKVEEFIWIDTYVIIHYRSHVDQVDNVYIIMCTLIDK